MGIIEIMREEGCSEALIEAYQALALDSIRLITQSAEEQEFALGETKIGGLPDGPEAFIWPERKGIPLAFIAQLDLKELATYDSMKQLPRKGLLSFFYEGGEDVWGFDPEDRDGFQVIYIPDTEVLKRVTPPKNLGEDFRFSACKVECRLEKSYPTDLDAVNQLFIKESAKEKFDQVFDRLYDEAEEETLNKVFGNPNLIQGDIFLEAQLVSNGLYCGNASGYQDPRAEKLKKGISDWIFLLQVDSDDHADMMWGDVGRIYFMIRKEDLANENFAAVWLSFQCS